MKFKNWLVKEDPEGVTLPKGFVNYFDNDSITFCLIDNFYVYSDSYTHESILLSLFENFEYAKPFPEAIKVIGFIRDVKKKAKFTKVFREKMTSAWVPLYPDAEDKFVLMRQDSLKYIPDLILGRLWTNRKVISFWNTTANVFKQKNKIIEFISRLKMKPYEFTYDVDNNLIDFQNFASGINQPQEIDRAKIHTLSPEKKGEELKKMGAVPKTPIDIRIKQQLHSESVGLEKRTVPFSSLGIKEVYHTGDISSLDQIDPFKIASKQNKKGREYGGFYVGPLDHADQYPGSHLSRIEIDPKANVLVGGMIDRVSVSELKAYLSQGIDMLWGKDIRGLEQGIIINKSAIKKYDSISKNLQSESVGLKVLEIPDPLGLGLNITAKIKIVPGKDGQGAYSGHLSISTPDRVGGLTTFTDFYHSLEAAQTALRELLQKPHTVNVTRRLIRNKIGEKPTNEPEEELLVPVEIKGLRSVGTHRLEPVLGYGGSWDQDALRRMPGYDPKEHEKHSSFFQGLQSVVGKFKKQTREESKKTKKFGDGPPLSGQWITKADVELIPDIISTFGDFKVVVKWSIRPRQIINASDFHKHYETIKKDAEVKTGDYMREVWVL